MAPQRPPLAQELTRQMRTIMDNSNSRSDKRFPSYNDDEREIETLVKDVYRILNRKLSGADNPVLRELATTDLLQTLLQSLHERGFVKSFKYRLQIDEPEKEVDSK